MDSDTLETAQGLCSTERFLEQPTAAHCSGTLVAPDLVITAGHCVENQTQCNNTAFVFDYFYTAEGTLETIETADVYSCATLETQRLDPDSVADPDDYAVVRLDRAVTGRTPASVHVIDDLNVGDSITVIGFGSGIPAKIDDGGMIARNSQTGSFTANTDTFGGHSGSGVFNDSGVMVGILVRGATDYVVNGSCSIVNVEPNTSAEEDISRVTRALGHFCIDNASESICAGVTTTDPGPEPTGALCENTCEFANDGDCDDGGPGADFSVCGLGTDCGDCGPRSRGGDGCAATAPRGSSSLPLFGLILLGALFLRRRR